MLQVEEVICQCIFNCARRSFVNVYRSNEVKLRYGTGARGKGPAIFGKFAVCADEARRSMACLFT